MAIGDGCPRIGEPVRTIHGLKQIMLKVTGAQLIRQERGLWVDELELVTLALNPVRARFGTDANPVNPNGRLDGAVCFDRDLKAFGMERFNQGLIDL